jgi:hypothetical protein
MAALQDHRPGEEEEEEEEINDSVHPMRLLVLKEVTNDT